jgi:FixJ family two-component response regulator
VTLPVLTIQQLRVVLQLADGRGYKRSAGALGISVHTVRLHVVRIAARLDGEGSPKEKVLRYADRLIGAQSIERLTAARGVAA